MTAGASDEPDLKRPLQGSRKATLAPMAKEHPLKGASKLFQRARPGSGGKLGKTSGLSESLSKLRGKGALA